MHQNYIKLRHFGLFLLRVNIFHILFFIGEFEQVVAGRVFTFFTFVKHISIARLMARK